MNTRILAFAGCKQSGKSTCSNFLHGYQLRAQQVIENFALSETGKLIVYTNTIDDTGKEELTHTFLDTSRKDEQFVEWSVYNMWPFIKKYSFADTLKEIAITLFDLKYDQVYGTEHHKNQVVPHLRWENMPGVCTDRELYEGRKHHGGFSKAVFEEHLTYHDPGPMTVREFLQFFGSNICRKIYEPIWVQRCIKDIELEQPLLAVIDDCRFENEIKAVQDAGGKVIGLTRNVHKDSHYSERVIEEHADMIDVVIDNTDKEIADTCKEVMDIIDSWGWLGEVKINNKKQKLHTIKAK